MRMDFHEFVSRSELLKRRLGVDESDEAVEALRNKGGDRTASKNAMLARAARRAIENGRAPIRAHFQRADNEIRQGMEKNG